MPIKETQILDEVIASSRRKMLTFGLTSLAGIAAGALAPTAQAASFTDADILNFALNLEYLEANFYYQAAFGTTIDVANTASLAAGALKITLSGTVGSSGSVSGGSKVPFTTVQVGSYAVETAVEEGKHVQLLLSALGSARLRCPAYAEHRHVFPHASDGGGYPEWQQLQPLYQRQQFPRRSLRFRGRGRHRVVMERLR